MMLLGASIFAPRVVNACIRSPKIVCGQPDFTQHLFACGQPSSRSTSSNYSNATLLRSQFLICHAAGEEENLSGSDAPTPTSAESELDEKERLRRQRISQANSGRTPWNKGRKHSPETLAKIKERTKEAMQRPEVAAKVQRYLSSPVKHSEETKERIRQKVAAYHEARRAALPPEEQKPKKETKKRAPRRPKAEGSGELAEGAQDAAEGAQPSSSKSRSRSSRSKSKSSSESGQVGDDAAGGTAEPTPKKKATISPERRAAIAEAIRKKWEDPEYRSRMVQAMKDSAKARGSTANSGDGSEAGSSSSSSSSRSRSSSSNRSSSSSSNRSRQQQQQQERLKAIKGVVDQVLDTQELVGRLEAIMAEFRGKMDALCNDPLMEGKARELLAQTQGRLDTARTMLEQLRSKIPPDIAYDSRGNVWEVQVSSTKAGGAGGQGASRPAARSAAVSEEDDEDVLLDLGPSSQHYNGFGATDDDDADADDVLWRSPEPARLNGFYANGHGHGAHQHHGLNGSGGGGGSRNGVYGVPTTADLLRYNGNGLTLEE